jgi:hypothetical protein
MAIHERSPLDTYLSDSLHYGQVPNNGQVPFCQVSNEEAEHEDSCKSQGHLLKDCLDTTAPMKPVDPLEEQTESHVEPEREQQTPVQLPLQPQQTQEVLQAELPTKSADEMQLQPLQGWLKEEFKLQIQQLQDNAAIALAAHTESLCS